MAGAGEDDPVIAGVTDDSRQVGPGDLFVVRAGRTSCGASYVGEAIARGAVAVLWPSPDEAPSAGGTPATGGAHLVCRAPGAVVAPMAECVAGAPSRRLALVAVTGTNGKTTVTSLLQQILRRGGVECGLIGTVGIDDGLTRSDADLTTPSASALSRILARMVRNGCRACAMEASSHALDQGRMAALSIRGAVFTNLTGDHLDYHGSMDAYAHAKSRLFAALPGDRGDAFAIVNTDDPWAPRMIEACRVPVIRTSLEDRRADAFATGRLSAAGTAARLVGPFGEIAVDLRLIGRHNLMNALQAAVAAHRLGVGTDALAAALAQATAPAGRLEPVFDPARELSVLVDYAHTDDALDNVLTAARPLVPEGRRLILVFGCGGDRDRTKRPRMARVAERLCDRIVVTSDNPRTESPESIIDEIVGGFTTAGRSTVEIEPDRARAIDRAVDRAACGDVIVIAGKGHETCQILGRTRVPFDDRRVAHAALAARAAKRGGAAAPREQVTA